MIPRLLGQLLRRRRETARLAEQQRHARDYWTGVIALLSHQLDAMAPDDPDREQIEADRALAHLRRDRLS